MTAHLPRVTLNPADTLQLRRHIRDAHPNLLGDPTTLMGYRPLPESGLSEVPSEWLYAIHYANHASVWRHHPEDAWLPERERAAGQATKAGRR